ncbi:MAG: DUF2190 family protein [Burkholderiales bacterium]
MKNFIQPGEVLGLISPYDVAGGQGALIGSIFGVSAGDYPAGEEGQFSLSGVYDLAAASVDDASQGDVAYWDDANRLVTVDATDNVKIGVFTESKSAGSAAARVRLNGSF